MVLHSEPLVEAINSGVSVAALRTEFVESPMGVETAQPLLSWQIVANRRGVLQSAYQIEVASNIEALEAGKPDLWDSGRIASGNNIGIPYGGAALSSRQRCFWHVRIWDDRDVVSAPSAVAYWEMGLLHPSDWSAQWLAAEDQTMRDDCATGLGSITNPKAQEGETSKFRLAFSVPAAASAVLYFTDNGKPDIWVDGQAVTLPLDQPFGFGSAKEIAMPLSGGRHVLAVLSAPKRTKGFINLPGADFASFLRIHLADGSVLRLTNKGWKTTLSSAADWQMPDFDDTDWEEATPVTGVLNQPHPKPRAVLLRHTFAAAQSVRRARIYATALAAYELHLNGTRVGDALLAPESTDFRKRALYRVYDVTEQIVRGENVLGAVVGDGWYASYTMVAGRYPWGPPPRRLLTQLELTYADGSREVVGTGPGWQTSYAPIVSSEIYDGEYYDARLQQPGWSAAGFNASEWWPAEIGAKPPIALTAQISPPIRREMALSPRNITQPRPGVFVFDFGQNFAGWCRLKVKGAAGIPVEMRFAELLDAHGEADQSNLRSARATDTYVLKGDSAGETYEPHFTYHGFRYVQVTGFPGVPTVADLEGVVIHSDLQLTAKLSVENAVIEKLWHNTLWSQRSNFVGIPTDCPQRDERVGWTGDANVFWDAAAFNMDVDAFTRRFMDDMRDAQTEEGAFSDFSPAAVKLHDAGTSPGWADAGVNLPWTVWQRYGDTGIIERNWPAMQLYLEFIRAANPDFVWRNKRGGDYGDWLALDAKGPGDPTTPKDLAATAMWSHSVARMAQMADTIGRADEARGYRDEWTKIAAAFQKEFVRADGGIGNDSQTGYILALRYDLVPSALRSKAAAKLAANVTMRGTLLSTGFIGTPESLDALADAGYNELVYSLLLRTEFPSWGYMVAKGATTIWERWNGDTGDVAMNSFNHYALGAVCGFIFRRIAAISPLEPGFRKIEVRPVLDPRVKRGGADYDSVLGRISTAWRQDDAGGFTLDLTVPPNATARVYLPTTKTTTVTESGQPLSGNPHVTVESMTSDCAILNAGSGDYHFATS